MTSPPLHKNTSSLKKKNGARKATGGVGDDIRARWAEEASGQEALRSSYRVKDGMNGGRTMRWCRWAPVRSCWMDSFSRKTASHGGGAQWRSHGSRSDVWILKLQLTFCHELLLRRCLLLSETTATAHRFFFFVFIKRLLTSLGAPNKSVLKIFSMYRSNCFFTWVY